MQQLRKLSATCENTKHGEHDEDKATVTEKPQPSTWRRRLLPKPGEDCEDSNDDNQENHGHVCEEEPLKPCNFGMSCHRKAWRKEIETLYFICNLGESCHQKVCRSYRTENQ